MDAHSSAHKRSDSQSRPIQSRPTTPLRPSSRTSLRSSTAYDTTGTSAIPLANLEPAFAELADGMADLEANFMHLQLMHESISRFSENFAAFLYGLNMNAFCVDFPEAPIADSFRRAKMLEEMDAGGFGAERSPVPPSSTVRNRGPVKTTGRKALVEDEDADMTMISTATSFVDNPASSKLSSRFAAPTPASRPSNTGKGIPIPRGGAAGRGANRGRASGIARGRGRAVS